MTEPEMHTEVEHDPHATEGIETEGLNAGAVGIVVVGGIVFIIAAMVVVSQFTDVLFQNAILESTTFTGYPLLEETIQDGEQLLSEYAPVEGEPGVYRIPIDRAMDLVVEEAQERSQ
jgi:hypothetical protein